jgi:hypothetical protein
MRTSRLFTVLAISAGLAGGTAFLAPAFSQSAKPEISYERTDLTISQVLVKLMATGYDNIDKIERERNAYEVRAIDKNGARIKLYVDPQTGDLIKPGRQGVKQERRATEGAPA